MNAPPTPFIVLALPRSRTAWLSRLLTYGPWVCGHDEIRRCRGLEDVRSWFMQPFIGTAETGVAPWWRLLERFAPGARVVTVRRPVLEVMESICRMGVANLDRPVLLQGLRRLDAKLDQIEARVPGTVRIDFKHMSAEVTCRGIFEFCLQVPWDRWWWEQWASVNVQVNFDAMLRYQLAHLRQLARLADEASRQVLVDLQGRAKEPKGSPVVVAEESFRASYPEALGLLREQSLVVGEAPKDWEEKHVPLLAHMESLGLLQTLSARVNGRLFGYLVTLVGVPGTSDRTATHSHFFVSKDWPGVGMKLQREALRRLRAKGVEDLFLRTGVGEGARVESLWRRLGASLDGKVYRLKLES